MSAGLGSALRRRFTPRRILLAVGLVVAFLALLALLENEEGSGPPDRAAELVPAGALAYLHATVDRDSEQWRDATRLTRRLPGLVALRDRLLRGLTARGQALDLEHEVYPWLGDEAALALLSGDEKTAHSLILLKVSDRELARSFLSRAVGRVRKTTYRATRISTFGKLSAAFLGGFLAIGEARVVRGAIDTRLAPVRSLARSPAFERARAGLPEKDRLLYGYASPDGLRRVLRERPGVIGRIARLADDPALEGAAVALRAERKGMRVDFASVLGAGSRRAAARKLGSRFAPHLLAAIPGEAIAYLGMRGADQIFKSLARAAGATPLRLPPTLRGLRSELSGRGGARLRRALGPALDEEAALFVTSSASAPVLTLVIDHVSGKKAGSLLERLQPLLSRLIAQPAEGQVPTFRSTRVAGLNAATLTVTPALRLTYAVFGGRAVVSTSPQGIRQVKSSRSRIADNPLFDREVRNGVQRVTSVLFLDLEQLFAIGEQAGLEEARGYRALRADLAHVSAVNAVTSATATRKAAAIFIEIP